VTDPVELTNTLLEKHTSCRDEYRRNHSYFNAEYRPEAIGIGTPPEMRKLLAQNGWGRNYVEALTDRAEITGFRIGGDAESADADDDSKQTRPDEMWNWWRLNRMPEQSDLGHTEALVHGRAFATVAAPLPGTRQRPGVPVYRVESPRNMFAEFDPITQEVEQALRVYQTVEDQPVAATLLEKNSTTLMKYQIGGWRVDRVISHQLGRCPVVPLLHRPMLSTEHGQTLLTAEIRSTIDAVSRLVMNMQTAAELMAVPQRILFGVAQEEIAKNPDNARAALEAYYSRIMAFEEPGGSATQFAAAELQNFANAIGQLSKLMASYTGLPPQYLTVATDNPASAEAIKSSESRLIRHVERLIRMFSPAWEEMNRLGHLVLGREIPDELWRMETVWADPSTPTYVAKAAATSALFTAGILPLEQAWIDMGYTIEQRQMMRQWMQNSPTAQLNALLGTPGLNPQSPSNGDKPTQASNQDVA
jgi:hypothetical protein